MKFTKIITVTVSCIIVFKLTLPAQDIHQASQKGDLEQVRVLLKKNPGLINMKNRYGMTPFHTASYYGNLEMIRFFLSQGVDIKSTTTIGKTALFYAYINRRENVVKFLKSKGLEELFIGFTELYGEYLGQKKPGTKPKLFAPGLISTIGMQHGNIAFTPEGREIYWTEDCIDAPIIIYYTKNENGKWTEPTPAPFVTHKYDDGVPIISPDGTKLFFLSTRPRPGESSANTFRRWYVERTASGFGNPRPMDSLFQSGWVGGIASTIKGNLYFMTYYPEYSGRCDIYVSKYDKGGYQQPQIVSPVICTKYDEMDFYIHPDESFIIYCSDQPGGEGKWDLYISFKTTDGQWGRPINLGKEINSKASDRLPFVTADQKYLFFMSDRNGNQDYYWVDAGIIKELKPKNL